MFHDLRRLASVSAWSQSVTGRGARLSTGQKHRVPPCRIPKHYSNVVVDSGRIPTGVLSVSVVSVRQGTDNDRGPPNFHVTGHSAIRVASLADPSPARRSALSSPQSVHPARSSSLRIH